MVSFAASVLEVQRRLLVGCRRRHSRAPCPCAEEKGRRYETDSRQRDPKRDQYGHALSDTSDKTTGPRIDWFIGRPGGTISPC